MQRVQLASYGVGVSHRLCVSLEGGPAPHSQKCDAVHTFVLAGRMGMMLRYCITSRAMAS